MSTYLLLAFDFHITSMAHDQDRDSLKSPTSTRTVKAQRSETTPLLRKESEQEPSTAKPTRGKNIVSRVLFTSFLVSLSFGVTQVP